MSNVKVTINRQAIARLVATDVRAGVARVADRVRDDAKAELTRAGRIDTGHLRASIGTATVVEGERVRARVGTGLRYAKWIHNGSAPRIYPRGQFLRFKPKGSNSFVFARSVQGIWPGNNTAPLPFLKSPLDKVRLRDFT